ncbi:large-conductance mechanosensitive channel protein MscL [Lentzea nigeriaca]|uniref:large-conductance mechanosensitive channel protein MscL n=1 Tax=Lentzea nigeriaca TaxID=1128665 RepID=UPI00195B01EF|nr:large-conductance mechanosensitive channel protein MscL [Lentzea nigeriaca]MBM7858323.1 large conductance mechanosensitive channel [Lentzea nigeriaca]
MLKGFKDFLMRGNVVDLAVAVVIGTAFTAIVTAFTTSLIKPLIAALGSAETKGLGFYLRENKEETYLDFSNVINAAINFVIVAAVVYFVLVLPIKKIQERRKKGEEPGPAEPTDVELLKEIRDLLAAQRSQQNHQTVVQSADVRSPKI